MAIATVGSLDPFRWMRWQTAEQGPGAEPLACYRDEVEGILWNKV